MGSASEYQKRAADCLERAEIVTGPIDRARWVQLAEQWSALSRLPLPKATLWREASRPVPRSSKIESREVSPMA